jgi:hypothetical protein
MFRWFQPKCPLGTWEKAWTETRMRWLADRLGSDRLLKAQVVLPTAEFFPEAYTGTEADAARLLQQVCGFLGAEAAQLAFEVCPDVELPGAAGHYDTAERRTIRIAASELADPESLVATLSHEVAHELLLGRGLLDTDARDHEWLTDLVPDFLGLGVFAANAVIRERTERVGNVSQWRMQRHGYLPARIHGYALALSAWVRYEQSPAWARHLRLDAGAVFAEGLRYLRQTGDSLFHPDDFARPLRSRSADELRHALRDGSPSGRLAALWELQRWGEAGLSAQPEICDALHDRDVALRGEAARSLGALGPAVGEAVRNLVDLLGDREPSVQVAAAQALGVLQLRPELVVPELCALLGDHNEFVVFAAAVSLASFAQRGNVPVKPLLAALGRATVACDFGTADYLAIALKNRVAAIESLLPEEFPEWDAEVRQRILSVVEAAPASPPPIDLRLPPFSAQALR